MTYEEAITKANGLTDVNYHTESAIVMAEYCQQGHQPDSIFAAYITILKNINDIHELQGHILPNQRDMRDLISNEVFSLAKAKFECGWDK